MSEPGICSNEWQKEALLHKDALYGYAMALSRNPVDAEDLLQQTFVQAMPHFTSLRVESNLAAWLASIMRNTWRKQLRRERSGPDYEAFDDTGTLQSPDTNGPQALSIRAEQRENIRAALQQLPKVCSEVVVLCCIEEFSYKEAAEKLDCPIGTVMSRLSRARTKLERLLGPELE